MPSALEDVFIRGPSREARLRLGILHTLLLRSNCLHNIFGKLAAAA